MVIMEKLDFIKFDLNLSNYKIIDPYCRKGSGTRTRGKTCE